MAEVTNELILEVLKAMHADVRAVKEWRVDVNGEFNAIRPHMAAIQSDVNNIHLKLGSIDVRLNRIEQRLDLVDTLAE